jgi:hypothetical protein
MGCGGKKLLKYLTQPCMTHCSATICQQVTLSGGAGWPKVAGAVIKAARLLPRSISVTTAVASLAREHSVILTFPVIAVDKWLIINAYKIS